MPAWGRVTTLSGTELVRSVILSAFCVHLCMLATGREPIWEALNLLVLNISFWGLQDGLSSKDTLPPSLMILVLFMEPTWEKAEG